MLRLAGRQHGLRKFLRAAVVQQPQKYWFSTGREFRNVAIIAHVDHGKTTLVDQMMVTSTTKVGGEANDRMMDSNEIESERGITILSKCTSVMYEDGKGKEYQLNIVDTPGHADFGGEVERIMGMVDGVALVVDATDGPMTQTRFVLSKALEQGLKPFVVINKVDRPSAEGRLGVVEGEIFDLFDALGATDEQMDFPFVYASAIQGWATHEMEVKNDNMLPLFETLIDHVPAPTNDVEAPFSMLISQVDDHPFFGTTLVGRIQSGSVKSNELLRAVDPEGNVLEEVKIPRILARRGLEIVNMDEAVAGDIISLPGFTTATVTSTIMKAEDPVDAIESIPIDPPTLSMVFAPNNSPLAGKEGSKLTSQHIRDRLAAELKSNVALKVVPSDNGESFEVFGRGELHLGILIETMRREGFELSVSAPTVVYKKDEKGNTLEPIEEVNIDVESDKAPAVIEKLSLRKGEMLDYENTADGRAKLKFNIPTRGLLGYRSEFMLDTRGVGILNSIFKGYEFKKGIVTRSEKGAMVSMESGKTNSYGLGKLEARGTLFVKHGEDVYPGMVIGEYQKAGDMTCNPTRSKQLTNMRASGTDETVRLAPPRKMTLEDTIAYVRSDENIEVTPTAIRLRKVEKQKSNNNPNQKGKKKK